MWQVKRFKTRDDMAAWLTQRDGRIQWVEVFINVGKGAKHTCAVEWRSLRRVY